MSKRLSLTGVGVGIYLVALGLARLVDQFTAGSLWSILIRFYPLLPILLGVEMALKADSKREGSFGRRQERWVIIAVLALTIFGLVWTTLTRVSGDDWERTRRFIGHNRSFLGNRVEEEQLLADHFSLPPGVKKIRIENGFGEVAVNSGSGADLAASAHLKLRAAHQGEIDEYKGEYSLVGTVVGERFILRLKKPDRKQGIQLPEISCDLTVEAPSDYDVEIKNSFGGVLVTELDADLEVENAYGKVEVEKVTGSVLLKNEFSGVSVGEVLGDLKIKVAHGDVQVISAGAALEVHNSFGDTSIRDVSGDLSVSSNNGEVKVDSVKGAVKVSSKFGNTSIGNVGGDLSVSSNNGEVKVDSVKGVAKVSNRFGGVRLKRCGGPVEAEVSNGRLEISSEKNLTKLGGDYQLEVKFGDLLLEAPSEAGFNLDATLSFGEIYSDFSLLIRKETTTATATGEVNGGGPLVRIRNSNGNLRLRKQ